MKTVLTLLLLAAALTLRAQVVTFDYQTSRYVPDNDCLQTGATVRYQIQNINSFAQKAIMNGSAISLTTPMPAQLMALFAIKADDAAAKLKSTGEELVKMKEAEKDATKQVEAKQQMVSPTPKPSAKKVTKQTAVAAESAKALAAATDQKTETMQLVVYCEEYYLKAAKIEVALLMEKRLLDAMADEYSGPRKLDR